MKSFLLFGISALASGGAFAENHAIDAKGSKMVIVDETGKDAVEPKLFVESGSTSLQGSPEDSIKAAYRGWQQACKDWKQDLKSNNKENLMIADCGKAEVDEKMHQSEKMYTYTSNATYKIRVENKVK